MKTTREVAAELGMEPAALRFHLSAGHVRPPGRRVGLAFVWSDEEVEAAKKTLANPDRRRPRYTSALASEVLGEPK
jgi:hypothetical protein